MGISAMQQTHPIPTGTLRNMATNGMAVLTAQVWLLDTRALPRPIEKREQPRMMAILSLSEKPHVKVSRVRPIADLYLTRRKMKIIL